MWSDRYHSRELTTPRAVRIALLYVLMNAKKHRVVPACDIDACSSAPWFRGFATGAAVQALASAPPGPCPVAAARTWLAAVGWKRHGLLRVDEQPGPKLSERGPVGPRARG